MLRIEFSMAATMREGLNVIMISIQLDDGLSLSPQSESLEDTKQGWLILGSS